VHGKSSLLNRMPGDEWRQFANVRAFLAYMWGHPGKKLLFMGQEIGQREEWSHDRGIRWELLEFDIHRKLQSLMRELNRLYRANPALYEVDFHYTGFEWVDFHDWNNSIIAFLRRGSERLPALLLQLHARGAAGVRGRRPGRGLLRRDPEHGFRDVRRIERRQRRPGIVAARAQARPRAQHRGHTSSPGSGGVPQAVIARRLAASALQQLTKTVVEAARESRVIGQAWRLRT
jgi:hypothetical protein